MIRMSFRGFSKEDFDFFIDRDENKRRSLKTKMETLWEAVRNRLPANLANKFRFGRVGVLRRDAYSCWASFSEYDDFPRYTHISMSLSIDGFRVWLNTETVPAINRLRENIKRNPLNFLSLLRDLVEGGYRRILLFEREKIEDEPISERWPWFTVLESNYSDTLTLIFLNEKIMELEFPVFNVEVKFDIRSIENREVLMSERLIETVVNVIHTLVPLHDFANR